MNNRTLVTGGAGFIGSHLCDALISRGEHVVVLDDFSTGRRENLAEAEATGHLEVIEGSILDRHTLQAAMKDCRKVYHLAVQCVRRSLGNPIENHDINATGTLLTLEAARKERISRFIYCSSSEVYGNSGDDVLSEDTTTCNPTTVYGAAKLAGEYYAKAYVQTYGVPTTVVRPFNAYGPREHAAGDLAEVIPRFVIRVLNGLPPIIFGNGCNGRDFTYVTEVAEGIASAGSDNRALGQTINIAFGQMVTVGELAISVAKICERPDLKPIHMEPRPGDVLVLRADTRKAQKLLNYAATIDIETGLKRYIDWFRINYSDPAVLLEVEPRNWRMPVNPESVANAQRK